MRSSIPQSFIQVVGQRTTRPIQLTIVGLARSERVSILFISSFAFLRVVGDRSHRNHRVDRTYQDHHRRDDQHPAVRIRFKQAEESSLAFFMNLLGQLPSFRALRVLFGRPLLRLRHLPSHVTSSIPRRASKCAATQGTNSSATEWSSRCPFADDSPAHREPRREPSDGAMLPSSECRRHRYLRERRSWPAAVIRQVRLEQYADCRILS